MVLLVGLAHSQAGNKAMAIGHSICAHLSWILSSVNGHLLIQPARLISLFSPPCRKWRHFHSAWTAWPPTPRLPFAMEVSTFSTAKTVQWQGKRQFSLQILVDRQPAIQRWLRKQRCTLILAAAEAQSHLIPCVAVSLPDKIYSGI